MNQYTFLKIYKDVAHSRAHPEDLTALYWDLKFKVGDDNSLSKWFKKSKPEYVEMALAIDAVAHDIHQNGDEKLQEVFPGGNSILFKAELDKLSGLEESSEIRKSNRGYATPLLATNGIVWLEKQQVGMTTKDDIKPAIKEYEQLHRAGIASPAEILTLSRYYEPGNKYEAIVIENGYDSEDDCPLVVGGPASVEMVDREGHLITSAALDKAFTHFMKNFRTRNINLFHSDVQVGWPLQAYISKNGRVFKSGVDENSLWLISELRDDTKVAQKAIDEVKKGNILCYSIAGSAINTEIKKSGTRTFMQVNDLELAEVTLCEKGVNQGAHFEILKSMEDEGYIDVEEIVKSLQGKQFQIAGFGVYLDKSIPQIVIQSDKSNAITDSIELQLRHFVGEDIPINVTEHVGYNAVPLFKDNVINLEFSTLQYQTEQPLSNVMPDPVMPSEGIRKQAGLKALHEANYRPSEEESKECHTCIFFSEKYCTKLHMPVEPEYVCDRFLPMPGAREAELWAEISRQPYEEGESIMGKSSDRLDELNDWLSKFVPKADEASYPGFIEDEKTRTERFANFLREYGFPETVENKHTDEQSYGFPEVLEDYKLPYVVNESGQKDEIA